MQDDPLVKAKHLHHLQHPPAKTEHSRSCPQQNAKKREIVNCNKLGGPAECSEENLVDDPTIEHIANQCCVHFASWGIDCQMKTESSFDAVACLTELNKKLSLRQFAQVFKAAGEKNPDTLSCEEVQRDCNNLEEWSAAALEGIKQLEKKGEQTEWSKFQAKGE